MGEFGDFRIIAKCSKTNARVSVISLSTDIKLPIFMPVATYGAMRSIPVDQLISPCNTDIILSNTYHLRSLNRNIKSFMDYSKPMLTDSGGFQIQSLPCEIVDEGVKFTVNAMDEYKIFTPENSMEIQSVLCPDIMMQLDDVVNPMEKKERHSEAVTRSIEWLDRAVDYLSSLENVDMNKRTRKNKLMFDINGKQLLFPIIQGGLNNDLRDKSVEEILKRNPVGVAIGGMCGGEDKNDFCNIIKHTVDKLHSMKYKGPIYVMGVGYPDDILICCALGTDMSDCVYPTRVARNGQIFSDNGIIKLYKLSKTDQFDQLNTKTGCDCELCGYSFYYLHLIKNTPNFCNLTSIHNLKYMANLTDKIRNSIENDQFDIFIKNYFNNKYKNIPEWITSALKTHCNIDITN